MQVYKLAEYIKSTVIAFAQDPDGYRFALIQRAEIHDPLCQVMPRVG
jgi:lactoylglutathione lyase